MKSSSRPGSLKSGRAGAFRGGPVAETIREHTAGVGLRGSRVRFARGPFAENAATESAAVGDRAADWGADWGAAAECADASLVALKRQCAVQGWREARERAAQAEADGIRELGEIAVEIIDGAKSAHEADLEMRSFAAEVAADSKLHPRAAARRLNESYEIVKFFPAALDALARGAFSLEHVRVLLTASAALTEQQKRRFEADVMQRADGLTVAQLRIVARRAAERAHPETIVERHRLAAEERTVWLRECSDGMAEIGAQIPAVLAYGVWDRLSRAAHAARRELVAADEHHAELAGQDGQTVRVVPTVAQLRADLFAELLLTGSAEGGVSASTEAASDAAFGTVQGRRVVGIAPQVSIVVPAHDASAAELVGYGAIDPATARSLTAAAAGWNRIAVDSEGAIAATDRYRPSEKIRRILEARDEHCRFPGCTAPVWRCDIDHTVEWMSGGPTTSANLAHLCRAHHTLKHPDLPARARWRVRQSPGGVLHWYSPTGAIYTDLPERKTSEPACSARSDAVPPRSSPRSSPPRSSPRCSPAPF